MSNNKWPLMKDNLTLSDRVKMASFCLFSNRFTNGPKVKQFESKWSKWLGSKYSLYVSSGSTAAIMVLSRLHMGMIDGIDRPAICSLVPNKKNYSLMLDLGANVIVSGSNLFQFALMGFSYYSIINKNTKPKIGILNIGTENNKGLEFLQEASDLILSSFLKQYFIGFIEPNKIT